MIIITGASDGLGAKILATAKHQGFSTLNVSRRINSAATENIQADLSKEEDVLEAARQIREVENPTALVLNAGVLSVSSIRQASAREYDRVLNINLKAPLLLLAELFDWIIENGVDVVVINSVAGRRPYKNQAVYDISKWGLRGLTEDLRLELEGTSCRVIGVYPGMLDTSMSSKLPTGPMPKSAKPTISSQGLAEMIVQALK